MILTRPTIYLAGSSRDTTRVRIMASALDESGLFTIAYRWWESSSVGHDAALSDFDQVRISGACKQAIERSALFWLLFPGVGMPHSSCFIELGMALAQRHTVTCVTGGSYRSLALTSDADFRDGADELGLRFLVDGARTILSRAEVP